MRSFTKAETCIDVFSHPDEFTDEVHALYKYSEETDFQLGFYWIKNLVDSVFKNQNGVRFYVLRNHSHALAILPLLVEKSSLGWNIKSLGNYYTSLYAPILHAELIASDLASLIAAVLKDHQPLVSFNFSPMDPKTRSYQILLTALKSNGLIAFSYFCFGNWYLREAGDWNRYLNNRSGTLRSTIKRMTKKIRAEGGELEIIPFELASETGQNAYNKVYSSSWKAEEPHSEFIPGLLKTFAANKSLRLGIVTLNSQAIAAQIWMVNHGKASIFKVAYDENYKGYAPGTLLTAMLMQHVLNNDQVNEVDFLTGDDPYKKNWMSHRRERWGIVAYNPRSLGGMVRLAQEIMGRIVRLIQSRSLRFVNKS
jgi:hypothetical protein